MDSSDCVQVEHNRQWLDAVNHQHDTYDADSILLGDANFAVIVGNKTGGGWRVAGDGSACVSRTVSTPMAARKPSQTAALNLNLGPLVCTSDGDRLAVQPNGNSKDLPQSLTLPDLNLMPGKHSCWRKWEPQTSRQQQQQQQPQQCKLTINAGY